MEKVDLFRAVSKLVTSINIRCVMGDDTYNLHADEIASIYYQLELSGSWPSPPWEEGINRLI